METFGQVMRRLRGQTSLRELARLTFLDSGHLSRIENGHRRPTATVAATLDTVLDAGGALVALAEALRAEDVRAGGGAASSSVTPGLEDVVTILRRVHRYRRTVDPEVLARLADHLDHLVEGYDQMDHSVLVPTLVEQRAWVDSLLDDCPDLRRRRELLHLAGGTAGLLGYIAVGRGAFAVARAYLAEGLCLAELAIDANLRAWVRGMQSIAEYYAGSYREALELAEDGLTSVGPTPQAARLLVNGVARAAGKLRDERRVRSAVDEALDLVHGNGSTPAGFPSSVTFGSYSAAQVASNAATAFLSLGQAELVEAYVHRALPDVEKSGSPWSRSLVLIDLATAVATSGTGDLDRAGALLLEALGYSAGRPIIAVTVRAKEFLRTAADRWGQARQIAEVESAVAALEPNRG